MELKFDFNQNEKENKGSITGATVPNISSSKTDIADGQEFGLSIIPTNALKQPIIKWKKYQDEIAPVSIWHPHYLNEGSIGIITGQISGNLECIDIDIKNDPRESITSEFVEAIPDSLLFRLICQRTPSGGLHYIYRCPEAIIDKNMKLALNSDNEVLIETRGQGGYFCTHKNKYTVLNGVFDFENLNVNIPIISAEEREYLLETARKLTRFVPVKTKTGAKSKSKAISISKNVFSFGYSESVVNDFNNKYLPLDLFLKHGWTIEGEDESKFFLLRSGSTSLTHSGYYYKDSKKFYCHSSSTEFIQEQPYDNFQILQTLEGQGDYKSTLMLLPSFGFPVEIKPEKVGAEEISKYLNEVGVRYDSFIQDLSQNGKIIEERDYNTLFVNLKKHFKKEIPRSKFEEIIKSHYTSTINPIQDFIEKYKDRQPMGTFEKWLDCLVLRNKSIDKAVVLHFLKKWYVGMIAQAFSAEYANEFFLSLISIEQGIGKTTFLRKYTLPEELHNYLKEHSLTFDDDFKVLMAQALLIIDDEMDGHSFEQEKTFKTVLSTKEITTRRKYDRRISTIKRRCSFAGSGNNLQVIREQQNRRIIPIEIEKMHFDHLAQIDLVDLFMEAYHLYISGFPYSYQRSDMNEIKHLYEDYIQKSDVDMILDEFLQHPETIGDIFWITNLDLVMCLSTKFPQFSKRINVPGIGKLMTERGYDSVRKGKNRTSCYGIGKSSRIIELISNDSQSWRINYGRLLDENEQIK